MHSTYIQLIIASILPILFAITVHEFAHGWVADRRGDHTARMMGRLTLNPIKHIDPIGTVLVPLLFFLTTGFMFGWAKPVPVNYRNLIRPKRDMVLVAIAGPLSNFFMAIFWAFVVKLGSSVNFPFAEALVVMGNIGISVNVFLGLLNLIPIPPLDGSRVVSACLPPKAAYFYEKIERFGFIVLILLLISGLLNVLLMPFFQLIQSLLYSFIEF